MLIPSNTTAVSSMQPLGTVVDVKDCNAGKRSLNCAVRTSTHAWNTDMTVFGLVARVSEYPSAHAPDLQAEFEAIVRAWRPELAG